MKKIALQPKNPAAKVVTGQKGGKGLTQNSVAAKLTGNSARGAVKKNLAPMVKKGPAAAAFKMPKNKTVATKGGSFKSFIGGK